MAAMPEQLTSLPRVELPLVASECTGLPALRAVGHTAADTPSAPTGPQRTPAPHAAPPNRFGTFDELIEQLAGAGRGVIMTMGKGGVGKTTMAARIAQALARAGHAVHLTTTDPAAHVEAAVHAVTLASGNSAQPSLLTVSRINPALETDRYASEVLAEPMEPVRRRNLKHLTAAPEEEGPWRSVKQNRSNSLVAAALPASVPLSANPDPTRP
jgi:arsenite-transporting ATPase